jgi:hypothetical protein
LRNTKRCGREAEKRKFPGKKNSALTSPADGERNPRAPTLAAHLSLQLVSCISSSLHKNRCHPERGKLRFVRLAKSKDLRLFFNEPWIRHTRAGFQEPGSTRLKEGLVTEHELSRDGESQHTQQGFSP